VSDHTYFAVSSYFYSIHVIAHVALGTTSGVVARQISVSLGLEGCKSRAHCCLVTLNIDIVLYSFSGSDCSLWASSPGRENQEIRWKLKFHGNTLIDCALSICWTVSFTKTKDPGVSHILVLDLFKKSPSGMFQASLDLGCNGCDHTTAYHVLGGNSAENRVKAPLNPTERHCLF